MPLLTVVTVVFNDAAGLARTLASVQPHLGCAEHWVIDGSTNDAVRDLVAAEADPRVKLLSEPDHGLYDAMNKGLDRATGDFVLFLNAGDTFVETFDPAIMLSGADRRGRVILSYVLEQYRDDLYLRPARNQEQRLRTSPAHPATAYPREAYQSLRFSMDHAVMADGHLTRRAIEKCGGVAVREVVTVFELGGKSSTYGRKVLGERLRDTRTGKERAMIVAKAILWHVLPRRAFYALLARGKYERVAAADLPIFSSDRGASRLLAP